MEPHPDTVDQLFDLLPDPQIHLDLGEREELLQKYCDGMYTFFASLTHHNWPDGDLNHLRDHVKWQSANSIMDLQMFCSQLARCGLTRPLSIDAGAKKERQLAYWAWIAKGRRDDECPLKEATRLSRNYEAEEPVQHNLLPEGSVVPALCAACGSPDATKKCKGCLIKHGDHITAATVYCNAACQTLHWKTHKAACKIRKQMYHATYLLAEIYRQQLRSTNIVNSVSVSEENGIITMEECDPKLDFRGKTFFQPVPNSSNLSDTHLEAVLTFGWCHNLVHEVDPLLDLLIKPLCKTLEEVTVVPKNAHTTVCRLEHMGIYRYNGMWLHKVIRATLKSGDQIAVDLTGAQYGWCEVATPWEAYCKHRVHSVTQSITFDVGAPSLTPDMFRHRMEYLVTEARRNLALHVTQFLIAWMASKNMATVRGLLKMTTREFEVASEEVVSHAKDIFEELGKAYLQDPQYRH
ncbi:hypothetical protein JX266_001131 [Neoarthrinium moseri]|nr:hypothetical protein JX266_001131 [Neoarthrinium moseri]